MRVVSHEPTMADALERLDRVLPDDLRASLRPPVSADDLDALRAAVEPFEVPDDFVALLGWADGQASLGDPWWPLLDAGVLESAAAAAHSYRWLCSETGEAQWNPLWLPVVRAEHVQAGVEMTADRPGVVVDASFAAGALTVLAPSLVAVIAGTAEMLEAGVPFSPPDDGDYAAWRSSQQAILDGAPGWGRWPYDRMIAPRVAAWPRHWRVARGLPAEPDAPRREPTPIASLPVPGRVTIEGHVIDRELPEGTVAGPTLITVADATGELRVLVQPDTPGRFWSGTLGLRIQVDTSASHDNPTPADELRVGVQLA
jgi:hypothetical protein